MMDEHYAAVLNDLRGRRGKLESEIRELDVTIGAITRLAGLAETQATAARPELAFEEPPMPALQDVATDRLFSTISVRWSVLWYLSEFADGFEKTGEIADGIKRGGYQTGAANFGNMVSAVLSNMKAKGEVEVGPDGGYRITEAGRSTWNLIQQGRKFKDAMASASEPAPLF